MHYRPLRDWPRASCGRSERGKGGLRFQSGVCGDDFADERLPRGWRGMDLEGFAEHGFGLVEEGFVFGEEGDERLVEFEFVA